jgi:hypothetical protein
MGFQEKVVNEWLFGAYLGLNLDWIACFSR